MSQEKLKEHEDYKKLAICEYNNRISSLRKEKMEYIMKTEEKAKEIKQVQILKQTFCKSVGGHTFREELEDGLYGERYKVCTTCGLEV
jgi:hypothetical protein